jgi:hypothetical protein
MAQSEWGKDSGGDFVARVLHMETLQEDFDKMLGYMGFEPAELPLMQVGTGESRQYRAHYTNESKKFVAREFGEDIERFGYEF